MPDATMVLLALVLSACAHATTPARWLVIGSHYESSPCGGGWVIKVCDDVSHDCWEGPIDRLESWMLDHSIAKDGVR